MSNRVNEIKPSKGIGILQIIFGAITIILSFLVMIYPTAGITTLIFFLSLTLLFIGAERIAVGTISHLQQSSRIVNIVLGALVIALGACVIVFPLYTTIFLVYLLSFGLFLLGVARIIHGVVNKHISKWLRALLLVVGILSLVVSFAILMFPVLGIVVMMFIIAVNLLIIGADSIAHGISSRKNISTAK
ncbi:MAG: DUF308 domain-containing protein [Candidatus Nitrosocosmicus sp.]|nr:DUF308 domain-containing protein [Candidatus Nitrosocosmicus sp.]MDN5868456.1 DUF308 domain-containing protein [Candidatus Nitrosocosmicus sp.]